MRSEQISKESRINESVFLLVGYTLIALMMTCAALTVASLLNRIEPTWQTWYIPVLCSLVALDRLYTYRRFRDWLFLSKEWLIKFGTQWIVILAVAKLVVGMSHGPQAFLAEIPLWYRDFGLHFFDNEFLITLVLIFITWVVCGDFAELLDELGLDEAVLRQDVISVTKGKPPARVRLLSLFFTLGSVLVILTALARFDLRAIFLEHTPITASQSLFVELPALAGGGASTLLYFMLGLALLSQTQFMALNVRWGLQRIPVSGKLAGRWALYSILFLVLMAIVVSLLPTSYTLNPLALLGYFLNVLFYILVSALQFIVAIVLFVMTPLFLLLGAEPPDQNLNNVKPLKLPTPPDNLDAAFGSPAWFEMVKSLGFWLIFAAIIIFSIVQFLRQHEDALVTLRKLPGWRFLEQAWHWMRAMFAGLQSGVSRAVAAGRKRLRARRAAAREMFENGFLNLRRLDPRQRVTFFYLALIRRGTESGLPRQESQTPYEYAATLEHALPAVDQDIDALTDAFIEARYSRREVAPEKANLVKTTWERIRKALRGRSTL